MSPANGRVCHPSMEPQAGSALRRASAAFGGGDLGESGEKAVPHRGVRPCGDRRNEGDASPHSKAFGLARRRTLLVEGRRSVVNSQVRVVHSRSPEETGELGMRLGEALNIPAVVLLCGPLGTGKTTLARGLAEGLGLQNPASVHSPSFTLVNIYQGRCPIYHVDLYRLNGERELSSVGLEDFIGREGVTIVEWGERLGAYGDAALLIEIEDGGGDSRLIRIRENKPQRPRRPRRT
jgi:tRNA threonylcarbamoyladenosine biosynthesis protein TsaE